MLLRSKQVSEILDVPATTLRHWANTFSEYLSPAAQASVSERGTPNQRKYDEQDIELLRRIQGYLAIGLTYEAIREALNNNPTSAVAIPTTTSLNGTGHEVAIPTVQIDVSELTTLLARSVALQEEILIELRREPAQPTSFRDKLLALFSA